MHRNTLVLANAYVRGGDPELPKTWLSSTVCCNMKCQEKLFNAFQHLGSNSEEQVQANPKNDKDILRRNADVISCTIPVSVRQILHTPVTPVYVHWWRSRVSSANINQSNIQTQTKLLDHGTRR